MATIYGASVFMSPVLESNFDRSPIGKNSEAIALGDLLTIASGLLKVATATDQIVGIAAKTQTLASDNQTSAKIAPSYIPAENATFLMGSNGDFTGNATDAGTYYKITGTTGAMLVDQASGATATTSRVVEIVKVDPLNIGGSGSGSGLRNVLVRFVKTPIVGVPTIA